MVIDGDADDIRGVPAQGFLRTGVGVRDLKSGALGTVRVETGRLRLTNRPSASGMCSANACVLAGESSCWRDLVRISCTRSRSFCVAVLTILTGSRDDAIVVVHGTRVRWARMSGLPVEGLKLTMSGCELHALLGERIAGHEDSAAWWRRQAARTPEEQTAEKPLLPEDMCLNEAERHEWRARVLRFIREHLDAIDMFRLGPDDLTFGELLPAPPAAVEEE